MIRLLALSALTVALILHTTLLSTPSLDPKPLTLLKKHPQPQPQPQPQGQGQGQGQGPQLTSDGRILVSIASFADPLCATTIASALLSADDPGRVVFALVDQGAETAELGCAAVLEAEYGERLRPVVGCPAPGPLDCTGFIRLIEVPLMESGGPVVARRLANSLIRDDDHYYMQIDSHTVFGPEWDSRLIEMLHQAADLHAGLNPSCSDPLNHVVISSYPNEYTEAMSGCNDEIECLLTATLADARTEPFGPDVAVNCLSMVERSSRLSYHQAMGFPATPSVQRWSGLWAAGLSFSAASVWRRVPYISGLKFLFHGEELLHAARMFTRGIDVFAPATNVVYHKYAGRAGPNIFASPVYGSSSTALVARASVAKVKTILGAPLSELERDALLDPIPDGERMGSARSLDQFWDYTLIDLDSMTFGQRCLNTSVIPNTYLNILPPPHAP